MLRLVSYRTANTGPAWCAGMVQDQSVIDISTYTQRAGIQALPIPLCEPFLQQARRNRQRYSHG